MTKRGLDEVYRCAAIKCVGGVGVTQPMRADAIGNPNSLSGSAHNHADAPAVQGLSAPGMKNWLLRLNLASVASSMQVAPEQVASFRDAQAGGIEQSQQNAITWFCFGGEDPLHRLFSEDPFSQAILVGGQRQLCSRIDSQVPHLYAETEQAFDRGQRTYAGDWSQPPSRQGLGEALQIRERLCGREAFLRDSEVVLNHGDSRRVCADWADFRPKVW